MVRGVAASAGQPAVFLLKPDIETTDDIQLALLEVEGLSGHAAYVFGAAPRAWRPGTACLQAARKHATDDDHLVAGYLPDNHISTLRRLALIEAVYFQDNAGSVSTLSTDHTLVERSAGATGLKSTSMTAFNRRKNEYLSHAFHKYKAKFFPRMARALANYTTPDSGHVLDPFIGSGTLGIEAALMGLDSTGIDIDPLSVEISQLKVDALSIPTSEVRKSVEYLLCNLPRHTKQDTLPFNSTETDSFTLPEFIGRKITPHDERLQLEGQVLTIRDLIRNCPGEQGRRFLRIALSHALATKISLRWMGTGDNRFSLSVAKRPFYDVLVAQATRMQTSLEQRDLLVASGSLDLSGLGKFEARVGDVRHLDMPDEGFDGVVTSPPYMPAASGRETYLRSRACSLTALDLMTEAEILAREEEMIGTILRAGSTEHPYLPESVVDLVEWMLPQRARKPKALATAAYFTDLALALKEMARVTKVGGRLAVVLSAQHVFYDLVSRNIVRTIDMSDTLSEMIDNPKNEIPLKVDRSVKIRLPKMDYAARPASKGEYSESILLATRV